MPKLLTEEEKKIKAWKNEGLTLVFSCKVCDRENYFYDISYTKQIICKCGNMLLLNEEKTPTTTKNLIKRNCKILYEG